MTPHMPLTPSVFRTMRPIFWIGLFFLLVELGLETRAHLRGWDTLIYGTVAAVDQDSGSSGSGESGFGPSEDFPFRGPIISAPKTPGTTRIWIASASHGEDIYTKVNHIFPTLLAEQLGEDGLQAEVLNASKAGTGIEGNLRMLGREYERWQPDIVVLYQLSVDIGTLTARFLTPAGTRTPGTQAAADEESANKLDLFSQAFERLTVYELLNAVITTPLSTAQPMSDDLGDEAREAFRVMVSGFVDDVRKLGAEPVLCTFAASVSAETPGPVPRDLVLFVHRWNKHLSPRGWLDSIGQLNDVIRDVAREKNVLLVDLETEIGGREDFFRDPVHFTHKGHRAVAEQIATAMGRRLMRGEVSAP